PTVTGAALSTLIARTPDDSAAVVADLDGNGTNALLLPAAAGMAFVFGSDSAARHMASLTEGGVQASLSQCSAISFDLDTPENYRRVCAAGMWRGVALAVPGVGDRGRQRS
ncbi:MAG: hypothetical protein H7125_12260, partial [Proteobacteria bacterium]|nr:hypothetical protein [Burkholderiales bacterium]